MKLSDIKPNPNNPRFIKDDKFKKLVTSLREFPEMMEKRPMVCVTDTDGKLYPLGGNMRLKALQELKYKEIPDAWIMLADEWSEEKRKEFTIKDNVGFGEWDWDMLANEWNVEELEEWGLKIPNWGDGSEFNTMTDEDVDITEEFDPIGSASDLHKVIFIFDNEIDAGNYFDKHIPNLQYKKYGGGQGKQWQVNLSKNYGK
jgi:hypothetical protein